MGLYAGCAGGGTWVARLMCTVHRLGNAGRPAKVVSRIGIDHLRSVRVAVRNSAICNLHILTDPVKLAQPAGRDADRRAVRPLGQADQRTALITAMRRP